MLGADRVLFGSGMTECNPFLQKGAVLDAEISNREKEMVLYKNAQRLFNI
jgi:predicted TIM-barrel fold metal-dependent hydrolase